MHSPARLASPETSRLPGELLELQAAIHSLPESHRGALLPLFDRVAKSAHRRQRILGLVQEALSQIRLDMKYLLFDLEATRRERDELRGNSEDTVE